MDQESGWRPVRKLDAQWPVEQVPLGDTAPAGYLDAHVSINSFVIEAIKDRLAAMHKESVLAIAHDVISGDAEILDRLATA